MDMLVFVIFAVIRIALSVMFFVAWVVGVIIANGFWSTLFAFFIPFWAYYLLIERWLLPLFG